MATAIDYKMQNIMSHTYYRMAEFDPTAQTAPQIQAQVEDIPEKKGNKLTRNTSHPFCVIITIIFTLFPIVYGIVTIFFNPGLEITYIVYAIGIALTFYHNKNFAGRFLGRLRWHTYTVEGKTYYYFESMPKENQSKCDGIVFWSCLWFIFLYNIALTIASILLVTMWPTIPIYIVGMIAGSINLFAYIRCSKDFKRKMREMAQNVGQAVVQNQVNQQMQQVI